MTDAYDAPPDVPQLLRLAAGTDAAESAAAVDELIDSVFSYGTVSSATVAAVPFLVELATTAVHHRARLVWTVGMLADPQHAGGRAFDAVRSAVERQSAALTGLLGDADDEVRAAAAYAVARAGGDPATLWDRLEAEPDDRVRASLVLALGILDPAAAAPMLREEAAGGRATVAAAVALLRLGLPWPGGVREAVVTALEQGRSLAPAWARPDELTTALTRVSSPNPATS